MTLGMDQALPASAALQHFAPNVSVSLPSTWPSLLVERGMAGAGKADYHRAHRNPRAPKLRLGLLSSDWGIHPVSMLLRGAIEALRLSAALDAGAAAVPQLETLLHLRAASVAAYAAALPLLLRLLVLPHASMFSDVMKAPGETLCLDLDNVADFFFMLRWPHCADLRECAGSAM